MQGLEPRDISTTIDFREIQKQKIKPRKRYQTAVGDLLLPAFMIREENQWRLVHYETDTLSQLPWEEIDISPIGELKLDNKRKGNDDFVVNLTNDYHVEKSPNSSGVSSVDYSTSTSHLIDLVPNPWHCYNLIERTFSILRDHHSVDDLAHNFVFIIEQLRQRLEKERDRLSKKIFYSLLEEETIRFLVVTEDIGLNRLPDEIDSPSGKRANREDGAPYQMSLFEIVPEDEFNQLETKVATYLDQQAQLFFWYRNRARKDYYVQGWKPQRIYADFIVTLNDQTPEYMETFQQVFVVETKGLHLSRSDDTKYKRSIFDICNEHAQKVGWAKLAPKMKDVELSYRVLDEKQWEASLNAMLSE